MPAGEVVCAAFSHASLPCSFHVVAPRAIPAAAPSSSSSSHGREKVLHVRAFSTGPRQRLVGWHGEVTFHLKPRAISNLTADQYLEKVLRILHAGSGSGAGQSDKPAAAKLRDDFVVVLDTVVEEDDDADARLRINLRRGGVCLADVALEKIQQQDHSDTFRDLAFAQAAQVARFEKLEAYNDELAAQLASAQAAAAAALQAKERVEEELLSKFVQLLNRKKLKIRELWEKLNHTGGGRGGGGGGGGEAAVPHLEDRPLSLRGSTQHIDDSDEGSEDPHGDDGGGGDDDADDSDDLASSITSSYNPQAPPGRRGTSKRKAGESRPARGSAAAAVATAAAATGSVKVERKAKPAKSAKPAVPDIMKSAFMSSSSSDDEDMAAVLGRRRKGAMAKPAVPKPASSSSSSSSSSSLSLSSSSSSSSSGRDERATFSGGGGGSGSGGGGGGGGGDGGASRKRQTIQQRALSQIGRRGASSGGSMDVKTQMSSIGSPTASLGADNDDDDSDFADLL